MGFVWNCDYAVSLTCGTLSSKVEAIMDLSRSALLWSASAESLSGWHVGATFGVGQILAAVVLCWNWERRRT